MGNPSPLGMDTRCGAVYTNNNTAGRGAAYVKNNTAGSGAVNSGAIFPGPLLCALLQALLHAQL